MLSSYLIQNVSILNTITYSRFLSLPGEFSPVWPSILPGCLYPYRSPSPDCPAVIPVSFLSPSIPFFFPPHPILMPASPSCLLPSPSTGKSCDTLAMNSPTSLDSEESLIRRLHLGFATVLIFAALSGTLLAALPPQKSQTRKLATTEKTSSQTKAAEPAPVLTTISVGGVNDIDPTEAFGSKSAPVVMEIFSDFQCPACKQLFITTTQKVMDNYVSTGKVYLIHRDFPLPMHAYSRVAASYSRAAAHIGRGEEVEQAIFLNQEKWEMNGDIQGTVAAALSPAEMKKVQAFVDAKTFEPLIEKDKHLGQLVPVSQTPYSVLHTKSGQTFPVVGFVSYDVLKTFLDQLVSQK